MENINDTLNAYSEICALAITQLAIDQHRENNYGAYFWITKNSDNGYKIFCHLNDTIKNTTISHNEKEIITLEEILKKMGYEVSKTKNGNILLTITKENIIKLEETLTNNGFRITTDKYGKTLIPRTRQHFNKNK